MSRPDLAGALRSARRRLPAGSALAARLPRLNRRLFVRIWIVMVIGWVIYTGPVAYADDPINVSGAGGFFFMPDLTGGGERLFYEKFFGFSHYTIYSEANWNDPLLAAMNAAANGLMFMLAFFGATIIAVTGWLFSMTSIDGMGTAVGNVMGASAEGTLGWVFPTALVLGAIITYATRNSGGEGMVGNLLWIVVCGTALLVLTTQSAALVNGVEGTRTAGANVVATMSQGATVNGKTPIDYPTVADDQLEGTPANTAVRKNIDSMWRTLIVTPWCLAEFGSIEACETYGADVVTNGGEDRSTAIDDTIKAQDGSSTATWVKGMDTNYAMARIVILLIALMVAGAFTLFVMFAALTATFALVMTYLLLIVGPVFVAMGCVPGEPRRWVMRWGRQLVSQLLMSIIAFMLFSAVLSLIAILFGATAEMGWLLSALLTMTALVAAIALRGRLEIIFNAEGSGSGINKSRLLRHGLSMMRLRGLRLPSRSKSSGNNAPPPPPDPGGGNGQDQSSTSGSPRLPPARQPRQLPAGTNRAQQVRATRLDERSDVREQYARADARSTVNAHTRSLPAAPERRQLPAGTPTAQATPAPRAADAGTSTPATPSTTGTRSAQASGSSPRPTHRADASTTPPRPAVAGEVISPGDSRAENTPRPAQAPSLPSRTPARVRYSSAGMPDAPPASRRRRPHPMPATPDAGAHLRARPGHRTHKGTTPAGTPRYRVPDYARG